MRKRILDLPKKGILIFALPMLLIALLTMIGPRGSGFHFLEVNALYIMLFFLVLGLALYAFGKTTLMFISFACCACLCYTLQNRSEYALGRPVADGGPQLKVAHFDLDAASLTSDSILAAIFRIDADVISVQGLNTRHFQVIHTALIKESYPFFQYSAFTSRPPGLVIYSKSEFSYARNVSNRDASCVVGKIDEQAPGGRAFHFIGLYFSPAVNVDAYAELQRQMQELGFQSNKINEPLLVFGNYNLKPWSRTIQRYKAFSRLKNSRRGMQPTQPHGYFSLRDHRTDHIFYSDHFKCISFETISCGTEPHLGICGTFEWIKANDNKTNSSSDSEL